MIKKEIEIPICIKESVWETIYDLVNSLEVEENLWEETKKYYDYDNLPELNKLLEEYSNKTFLISYVMEKYDYKKENIKDMILEVIEIYSRHSEKVFRFSTTR